MPESRKSGKESFTAAKFVEGELKENDRDIFWKDRLKTEADVGAQKEWQHGGNEVERRAKEMFDIILVGKSVEPTPMGLPETDALMTELARVAKDLNYQVGEEWREIIEKRRHLITAQGEVNVLSLLSDPKLSASARLNWWQKEMAGLLRYTLERDLARLRDFSEPIPPAFPDEEKNKSDEPTSDALPPPQMDELRTSMDELVESKEGKSQGYFSVHPFWGGYYRENVYEKYQGGNRWKRGDRNYKKLEKAGALVEERVFRGQARPEEISPLPLPYGFLPDAASVKASEAVKIVTDQHGCHSIDTRGAKKTVSFTLIIGRPKYGMSSDGAPPVKLAVDKPRVGKEAKKIVDEAVGVTMERARKIKKFVRETLTYSNDSSLNAAYNNHRQGYFAAIEEYKKADCDVANAYYINLLSAIGIRARMVTGHYVKNMDHRGAAVMGSGSRHAWTEVWDDVGGTWVRFDATPPGDPTIDEDRPDDKSEDEVGPRPGDYGEEEAPRLTEEDLEKWRKKLAEAAERAKEKTPEQIQNEQFAKEAGCGVEEAAKIRANLEAARRLRDHEGRLIRQHLSDEFQKIVESNYKESPVWKGPVMKSEGEEMDNIALIGKEVLSGNANPLGYRAETVEKRLAQEYGGMDVYMVADRSGSMNEIDETSQKSKKEEQQLALFLFLDSLYGFSYKTETATKQDQLVSPLSVRAGVIAFQDGSVETIKRLGATWKPKEQADVWKGLETNVGGGTPAHLGLAQARQQIEKEIELENKSKNVPLSETKRRLRLVMVFMDGGVQNAAQYLAEQSRLEELGVYVSSWGMTKSAEIVSTYPNGHCVESARQMIEPITENIIEKAQALKLKR